MSILEKTPDDPQRELELLRELVKAKDALIDELSKRPIASPPVYVPYPGYPTYLGWPPWVTNPLSPPVWTYGTITTSANTGSINIKAAPDGKGWQVIQ